MSHVDPMPPRKPALKSGPVLLRLPEPSDIPHLSPTGEIDERPGTGLRVWRLLCLLWQHRQRSPGSF
jgi:hypothetical protein